MVLDKVKCEMCGKEFKQINKLHLNAKHNIDMIEYKNKFPNSKTTSDGLRMQISELTKIGMYKPENWKKFKKWRNICFQHFFLFWISSSRNRDFPSQMDV